MQNLGFRFGFQGYVVAVKNKEVDVQLKLYSANQLGSYHK